MKISNLKMGLSMAASWAWGVSLAVSFSILETKGLIPFTIWGFCNIAALLVFGMFTLKYPTYLNWMDNRIAKLFMLVIQIFSIWINIKVLAVFTSAGIAMLCAVALCFAVSKWGFSFSVKSDIAQYLMMIIGLIMIILIGLVLGSFENKYQLLMSESYITWAIYGGIGLLSGPFLDVQQLQRAANNPAKETFVYASGFFGIYLLLVFLASFFKAGVAGWIVAFLLAISIMGITTSTIDAAVAALYRITTRTKAIIISLAAISSWWVIQTPTVSDFWYLYATSRIYVVVPMILIVVMKWQWMISIKEDSYFMQKLRNIKTILQKRS
jgi:hypothetical protein